MPAWVASTPAQASGSASSKRAAASDQALDEKSPTRRRSGEERNPKRKHEGNGEEELEASPDARVVDAELSINSLKENHHDECVCALVHEIKKSGQKRVVCEEPEFFEAYLEEFYDDFWTRIGAGKGRKGPKRRSGLHTQNGRMAGGRSSFGQACLEGTMG